MTYWQTTYRKWVTTVRPTLTTHGILQDSVNCGVINRFKKKTEKVKKTNVLLCSSGKYIFLIKKNCIKGVK